MRTAMLVFLAVAMLGMACSRAASPGGTTSTAVPSATGSDTGGGDGY